MEKIKKYRYEMILFFINSVEMILELVASRILSPYFGSTNIVWTTIIGIILLSSSIGNYIGGKLADKKELDFKIKIILLFSGLFIYLIPLFQNDLLNIVSSVINNNKIGALISTILLFFVPSLLIGFLTPMILKQKLEDLDSAGKTSGRIYAIATIGGIIGTFLGGFYLIPNIGSIYILYALSIIVCLLAFLVDLKIFKIENIFILFIITFAVINLGVSTYINYLAGDDVLRGVVGVKVSYDTEYGRVMIYNGIDSGEKVRILEIDSGYETVSYISEDKKYDLYKTYLRLYDLVFNANREIKDTLLIGGGGYSYPRHYISSNPDKTLDVVEIDSMVTELAKKYFYLDDLIKEYNLDNNKRLNIITDDGRTYLNNNVKKYDAIFNDAFSSVIPVRTLATKEAVEKIKSSLNENGVYMTNIIGSLEGENSKFLSAEVNTLKQVFKYVYVVPFLGVEDKEYNQNNMVIATDDYFQVEGIYNFNSSIDMVLTDDYSPIDTLIPKEN